MKKILLTMLLAAMVAGCSTQKEDPMVTRTREYAAQQVKQYYYYDIDPKTITVTECDFDIESPYRASVYNAELSRIYADYVGNRISHSEYLESKSENIDRFLDLDMLWTNTAVFENPDYFKDKFNYSETRKPMCKCVADIGTDSVAFFVLWCNEAEPVSNMSAKEILKEYKHKILSY